MSSELAALSVESLQFAYDDQQLKLPDVVLRKGESCAVLGPSGCGKTTFLHLMAGLLTPQSGVVTVAGQVMNTMSQRGRDRWRGQHIGIVLQQLRLVGALTVLENLQLAQRLGGASQGSEWPRQLLTQLGLDDMVRRRPAALSQGQAQRVAIARALVNQPAVILADEPTSSLDDKQAEAVIALLSKMAITHDAALVVVTHDARWRGHLDKEVVLA